MIVWIRFLGIWYVGTGLDLSAHIADHLSEHDFQDLKNGQDFEPGFSGLKDLQDKCLNQNLQKRSSAEPILEFSEFQFNEFPALLLVTKLIETSSPEIQPPLPLLF